MMIRSVQDLNSDFLEGKRVFLRVDFNVPMTDGHITDDSRIRLALPTLKYLISCGARLVLASHFNRPKGTVVDAYRLSPIGKHLSTLLNQPVESLTDCIGPDVVEKTQRLTNGDVLLLENLRFHPGEESNDAGFSRSLADNADIFVNDAFGAAHRAHASTVGITSFLPSYAGLLMSKEVQALGQSLSQPKRPFLAIIGGAKVSSKFAVLKHLLGKVDDLIIGGGMVYTFFKAQGLNVGTSLVEDDLLDDARNFLEASQSSQTSVHLPLDHRVANAFSADAEQQCVPQDGILDGWMGLDIGPDSIQLFQSCIQDAQMILWNGPMGVFEFDAFSQGTFAIAKSVADSNAYSIVGGGDSVAALNQSGQATSIDHISTGGGASLEFLEGRTLPGVSVLQES